MLGDDNCPAFGFPLCDYTCKIFHRISIKIRSRFVKHYDLGEKRVGRCTGDLLHLTARKGEHISARQILYSDIFHSTLSAQVHILRRNSKVLHTEHYLVIDLKSIELRFRVLKDRRCVLGGFVQLIIYHISAEHLYGP